MAAHRLSTTNPGRIGVEGVQSATMRFDDDTAPVTTLVRTPPDFAGERKVYEVSDEHVERAVDEIKALGATPIVGSLTPANAEDIEDEARMHADETGGDLLADYATAISAQGHEQNTGHVIAENLARPGTPVDETVDGDDGKLDGGDGNPIPTPDAGGDDAASNPKGAQAETGDASHEPHKAAGAHKGAKPKS